MTGDTRDPGRVRLCAAATTSYEAAEFPGFASCPIDADGEPNVGVTFTIEADKAWLGWDDTVALHKWLSDLLEVAHKQSTLAALELLLPFAPTAPAWAIQAARDAIEQARGGAK